MLWIVEGGQMFRLQNDLRQHPDLLSCFAFGKVQPVTAGDSCLSLGRAAKISGSGRAYACYLKGNEVAELLPQFWAGGRFTVVLESGLLSATGKEENSPLPCPQILDFNGLIFDF